MRKTDFMIDEKKNAVELEYNLVLINEWIGSLCAVNFSKELLEKLISIHLIEVISKLFYL